MQRDLEPAHAVAVVVHHDEEGALLRRVGEVVRLLGAGDLAARGVPEEARLAIELAVGGVVVDPDLLVARLPVGIDVPFAELVARLGDLDVELSHHIE